MGQPLKPLFYNDLKNCPVANREKYVTRTSPRGNVGIYKATDRSAAVDWLFGNQAGHLVRIRLVYNCDNLGTLGQTRRAAMPPRCRSLWRESSIPTLEHTHSYTGSNGWHGICISPIVTRATLRGCLETKPL
jgi:hypothetical protein